MQNTALSFSISSSSFAHQRVVAETVLLFMFHHFFFLLLSLFILTIRGFFCHGELVRGKICTWMSSFCLTSPVLCLVSQLGPSSLSTSPNHSVRLPPSIWVVLLIRNPLRLLWVNKTSPSAQFNDSLQVASFSNSANNQRNLKSRASLEREKITIRDQ